MLKRYQYQQTTDETLLDPLGIFDSFAYNIAMACLDTLSFKSFFFPVIQEKRTTNKMGIFYSNTKTLELYQYNMNIIIMT